MGSWDRILVEYFFHAAAMLLFYIIQRITIPKVCIFRKSITINHCMALLQVALLSITSHKFVRLPCWHYRLYEIEKLDFRVVPDGITSMPNFIQIRLAVLDLNHADRQTDMISHICVHFMHIVERINYIQDVLKVALPKFLVVIIRRCQMCIELAGQFEQFL
jgi:hypothetical protein